MPRWSIRLLSLALLACTAAAHADRVLTLTASGLHEGDTQ